MQEKIELLRILAAVILTMLAMIIIYVFTTWALRVREANRFKIKFTKNKKA